MMAKSCSNFDGNTCSRQQTFHENNTYEPLLPADFTISMSSYDTLQNNQQSDIIVKNTTSRAIDKRDGTKEHIQTSEKITTLNNNTAEVKQDVYYSEIQTRTSCNSDIYESIDDQAVIPTNCSLPHLNNSSKKPITDKGRRGKHLACFIFGFLLVGVIAGTTMCLLLKNNETPCSKEPCFYNGTCTELGKLPICACSDGYNGSRCEVTPCKSSPCSNGGECAPAGSSFVCSCPTGYSGNQCHVTPCNSSPCSNWGECTPAGSSFVCTCPSGYSGKQCQITPCNSSPCSNEGECTPTGSSFACTCPTGYSGKQCEVTPCNSSPCSNGGECTPTGSSFACTCPTGYSGKQCEGTPCHSSPCLNRGTCKPTGSSFDCSCLTGYRGKQCQIRPTCPSGWKMNENSCYYFSSDSKNWDYAKIYCTYSSSILAEVTSRSEMIFLRTNAKKYGKTFWLGGSDLVTEGVWLWTTSGQRFTVTDWHIRTRHEPNNLAGNEHCLNIFNRQDYEWNDETCSENFRYICEKPLT